MSSMIEFTRNYRDASTTTGYQFEFYCDHCGSGLMSPYKQSKLGLAGGVMRAASSFFGGLGGAASAASQSNDLLRGKERDEALRESVAEVKKQFNQCKLCGSWVCQKACWNSSRNLCQKCAPDLDMELASAQNKARAHWMQRKALQTDMIADIDITKDGGGKPALPAGGAKCECGATITGKFCPECGKPAPAPATKKFCSNCGNEAGPTAKFCGTCGTTL
ncbi:MAG: hypothetical protein HBSAPP03_08480 [Phycisphaerae bacterium]|nr:MAG: hypothetical protein HBSAPP03_08480 [Phycisphaerae bacterium]